MPDKRGTDNRGSTVSELDRKDGYKNIVIVKLNGSCMNYC